MTRLLRPAAAALAALVVSALLLAAPVQATPAVAGALHRRTANLTCGPREGSCVFVKDSKGGTWAWTAHHVAVGCRPDQGGKGWKDCKIRYREVGPDGLESARADVAAEVVRTGGVADLALLHVPKLLCEAARWDSGASPLGVGLEVYSCGSPLGIEGVGTVSRGIVSAHGRPWVWGYCDQCSAPTFPGNSGGGIFSYQSGDLVGILVGGAGETMSLYVPSRLAKHWAKTAAVQFAFDGVSDPVSLTDLRKGEVDLGEKDRQQQQRRPGSGVNSSKPR